MPQRKQRKRDGPPESQSLDQNTKADEALNEGEEQVETESNKLHLSREDECSASLLPPLLSDREKQWRDRKHKAEEMTEEEMMALALHLSAQEASVSAHQVQQEEAAVMKAIKDSMFGQTQEASQSQSLLTEADTSCSRRSRSYPKAGAESSDVCTNLSREGKGKGETNQDQKCKTKEAPVPDLSQSHDVCTQALPSSYESALEFLDSPQSCDSTQIDECPLRKSPVSLTSGRRATVAFPRLSQDLLETCKTSGFVLCSQLSPESVPFSARHKSPVFSESETGDDGAEYLKSPVFGDEARRDRSRDVKAGSPDGPNLDFRFSSQESLSPSVRPSSCPPMSPVFPRSPAPSKNSPLSKSSPVFSGSDGKRSQDVHSTNADRRSVPGFADDSSETELLSDMTLRWSDNDADDTLVSSPSPVFPEEKRFQQADAHAAHLNPVTETGPETSSSSCNLNTQQCVSTQPTVHYYWGVPFCPRGLDADAYTQVIVAQMEVYEKSLKEAQRCLLRKAEWGDAILPQSEKSPLPESSHTEGPRRRGLRRKYKKLFSQDVDNLPVETEEEEEGEQQQQEEEEVREKDEEEEKDGMEEEGTAWKEGEQMDTDDYVICPETQMSGQDHTDLAKPNSPECPETAQRGDESVVDDLEDEEESMEANGETQTNHLISGDIGTKPAPTNEEEERVLRRSCSPELDPVGLEAAVECPMCQGTFPMGKIERHAAYCDGKAEPADADERLQVPLKPRRKRKRWAADEEGDASSTDNSQEKCYICQKAVALREYATHTELCIQRRATKTPGKGNLLAALENIESRHTGAGPSRCRLQQG
ncbi:BRCA1-A complex subunit RAP80 [Phyllopteryx taeniolatus]|uniref:BRCA1-A complex subunit RAP80 n=1 Tax=Phyllopteryx taeniolatus TaxID=161469 RepID=UPI002AD222B5|nr:BRCA1-A complex subunit RAP80 [Phyllopteryx taeniolatus]